MKRYQCNMCGKDFDEFDEQNAFGIHRQAQYGSGFDGSLIELDLCCDCFDKLMEQTILPYAKIDPISDAHARPIHHWMD